MKYTVLAVLFASGTAVAQDMPHNMMMPPRAEAPPPRAATPWAQANAAAMQQMDQAMMQSAGGATEDEAFARSMLPHHQGAVDMARIELQYGRDPEMRRLAARVVATQTAEIREMSAWLARHH